MTTWPFFQLFCFLPSCLLHPAKNAFICLNDNEFIDDSTALDWVWFGCMNKSLYNLYGPQLQKDWAVRFVHWVVWELLPTMVLLFTIVCQKIRAKRNLCLVSLNSPVMMLPLELAASFSAIFLLPETREMQLKLSRLLSVCFSTQATDPILHFQFVSCLFSLPKIKIQHSKHSWPSTSREENQP